MSRDIPITEIEPNAEQPRQHFAGVEDLAASLDQQGQAVPIAVRPVGGGYQIIHGERRFRAARSLGWETIEATVRDVSEAEARWLSLVENVQRDDLTPIEEARAYQRQIEAHDLTQTALAEKIGKSQSYVAQKLRLLRLPSPVSFWIERGALTEGHVRQIMRLKGIYPEGATRTVDTEGTTADVLFRLRPLRVAVADVPEEGEPTPGLLREAVERLREHASGEAVCSWHVCAFWYAALAYRGGLSVATLKDFVDRFRVQLYSAALPLMGRSDPAKRYTDKRGERAVKGWKADLRHAGVDMDADFPGDFYTRVLKWMGKRVGDGDEVEGSHLLPSTMQGELAPA